VSWRDDQRGRSALETLGIAALVVVVLVFIPPVRHLLGTLYDETLGASVLAKGIFIVVFAMGIFFGAGYLILSTNLGTRLGFLVAGAAIFGWSAISGLLFTLYAPRGIRPALIEGLNAFQVRIPAAAFMIASLILFLMFLAALNRYEADRSEDA
jgi:hypothetical protein